LPSCNVLTGTAVKESAGAVAAISEIAAVDRRLAVIRWEPACPSFIMTGMPLRHPVTPDRRYFVVKGRLWRLANPHLSETEKSDLVSDLMRARRSVKAAQQSGDLDAEAAARHDVDVAKRALGERGEVWWTDGDPDFNRHLVKNTPYASWFAAFKIDRISENA
jgi:hypothetical protein